MLAAEGHEAAQLEGRAALREPAQELPALREAEGVGADFVAGGVEEGGVGGQRGADGGDLRADVAEEGRALVGGAGPVGGQRDVVHEGSRVDFLREGADGV